MPFATPSASGESEPLLRGARDDKPVGRSKYRYAIALAAAALLVVRRRNPKAGAFRAPGYPWTTVLFVLDMGPDAYKDEAKFPNGPYCKVGDFVLVRTYSGTRFKIFGKELRLLSDDQIEAVVEDPRGISRVAA